MSIKYVPGMRVEIRDEQWIIRKVELNSSYTKQRGQTLYVQGLSKFVKDIEAIFLDNIEDIKIIRPEETKLIFDSSPNFIKSRLYIESKLRKKMPTDNKLYIGHKAAMNLMDYQLTPAIMALENTRQRILIADAVGLGKTLEAGILMSELIARGKGKRILVVTVKSMMTQFQKEMWSRFSIPLTRLDSNEIKKVKRKIPSNHNPFNYYDKTIVSVDTLKRDVQYKTYLENARWDIIVIDEAHNVAKRGNSEAQRARLAELLSKKSETLIMLSATPHDGKAKSFASLMNMLDPTAIANEDDYTKEDIKGLCVRRFKKDIQDQASNNFKERLLVKEISSATYEEEEAYDYFTQMNFKTLDTRSTGSLLFKTVLEKSLFSSPMACLDSVEKRIEKLSLQNDEDSIYDKNILKEFKNKLEKIKPEKFSRYTKLLSLLNDKNYGWDKKAVNDRIVIFTERLETMKFLKTQIAKDCNLKDDEIVEFHGSMSDLEQQKLVDEFGSENSKIKIMVATDVASEGINLHYMSHRMIHFDIPWSLMVFQQRNGRIDRYGQERTPDIRYLVTLSSNEKIKGDIRLLEILIEKEDAAEKNIGDTAVILNAYDSEEEVRKIAEAIENGNTPEQLFASEDTEVDWLTLLLDEKTEEIIEEGIDNKLGTFPSLFKNDFEFLVEGLNNYSKKYEFVNSNTLDIEMDKDDLLWKLEKILPDETINKNSIKISTDIDKISESIKESRKKGSESWPMTHYLWRQHPIFDWLNDKNEILFSRQEAPILAIENIPSDEFIFIIGGLIPNKKSVPVIDKWYGIKFVDNKFKEIIDIEGIQNILAKDKLPNLGKESNEILDKLNKSLPEAISKVRNLMQTEWKNFEDITNPRLNEELNRLEQLKLKHMDYQLSLFEGTSEREISARNKKNAEIEATFKEFFDWIDASMSPEKENPYIHIVAVLAGV